MKPKYPSIRSTLFFTICVAASLPVAVYAAEPWDGTVDGGAPTGDPLWSNGNNWVNDIAPLATDDTLTFDGTVGLSNTNDYITTLGSPSITFGATAGAFVLDDDGVIGQTIIGNSGADTDFITNFSTASQTIGNDVKFIGGGRYRDVEFASGAGAVTISGNIDFANDWLHTVGTGTLTLSGNNSGDGAGNKVNGNGNNMRASVRIHGPTNLILSSATAFGNSNASTTQLKGASIDGATIMSATSNLVMGTSIAYSQGLDFNSTSNLEIAGLVYNATSGRILNVSGAGSLSVSGAGFFAGNSVNAQVFILQVSGAGNLIIDAPMHDTFQAGGITGTKYVGLGGLCTSYMRKYGPGTLVLNGDSSATFNGEVDVRTDQGGGGTVKLGNPYALGPWGGINLNLNATLDGTTTVTVADATSIAIGQTVTGASIPGGATVVGFGPGLPPTAVILSAPATATTTETLNFSNTVDAVSIPSDTVSASPVVTVTDATGIGIGYWVRGRDIPTQQGFTVIGINTSVFPIEITLNKPVTGTSTGYPMTFGRPGSTEVRNGTTVDLNGQTTGELFTKITGAGVGGNGAIINSNTSTPAQLTSDIRDSDSFTVGGAGDITLNNYVKGTGDVTRTLTKVGTGTFTAAGSLSNDRFGMTVSGGNVNLAKTSGVAVALDGLVMNAGTGVVSLTGASNNQINDSVPVTINAGTFDLNGKSESIGALIAAAAGGTVTNNGGVAATLTVGAGSYNTDQTFAGAITDGTSKLNLQKGQPFVQTLTGANTYTGDTTINNGTLALGPATDLADSSTVRINGATSILKLTDGITDVVNELWIDGVKKASGTWGSNASTATNKDNVHFSGTGVLSVTNVPAGFSGWITGTFAGGATVPAGKQGPNDDPDNDGISNLVEYAVAGQDPTVGNPNISTFAGDLLSFTKSMTATGLSYAIEESTDLGITDDWTEASGDGYTNDAITISYQLIPGSPVKNFARLRVIEN